MKAGWLMTGGGLLALIATYFGFRKASKTVEEVREAVTSGGTVKLHATGYWPFAARADEKQMEGGVEGAAAWNGRRVVDPSTGKRVQLHTVEDFLAGRSDYVSLSGDPEVWPFGQRVSVQWFDKTIVGRYVDTGSHFHGAGKAYRIYGEEPTDFCVQSSKTPVPKSPVPATPIVGDHWDKEGAQINTEGLKGQTVALSGGPPAPDKPRGLLVLGTKAGG